MTFTIRPEAPSDAPVIDAVVTSAFLSAPHRSGTEAAIVRALRNAGALTLSLVAVTGGKLIGHVAASPVTIGAVSSGWYGLGPVAVLPQEQGHGVGSRLVEQALRRLRQQGAAGCVVLGEPAYYGRFGFAVQPGMVLGGVPPGYLQALAFDGATPQGAVRYHPDFEAGP